jgi:hypothetical protein
MAVATPATLPIPTIDDKLVKSDCLDFRRPLLAELSSEPLLIALAIEYLKSAMPGKFRYTEKKMLVKIRRIINTGKP